MDAVFIIVMAGLVGKRKAERAATERQSTRSSGRSYLKSIRNDTPFERIRERREVGRGGADRHECRTMPRSRE